MKKTIFVTLAVIALFVNVSQAHAFSGRVEVPGRSPFFALCRLVEVDTTNKLGNAQAACGTVETVTVEEVSNPAVDAPCNICEPKTDDGSLPGQNDKSNDPKESDKTPEEQEPRCDVPVEVTK